MNSWQHIVASGMGVSSYIPQNRARMIKGIGEYIDFGDMRSYALVGSSIEFSQAQLMYYLENDYSDKDIIIYGFTGHLRLPFINERFNKDHGFNRAVIKDCGKYDHYLYYTTEKEKSLKSFMTTYILNTLPNTKVFIDCFENVWSGHEWHIKGNLHDISLAEEVFDGKRDHRPNHLGSENHHILGNKLVKFLKGDYSIVLFSK